MFRDNPRHENPARHSGRDRGAPIHKVKVDAKCGPSSVQQLVPSPDRGLFFFRCYVRVISALYRRHIGSNIYRMAAPLYRASDAARRAFDSATRNLRRSGLAKRWASAEPLGRWATATLLRTLGFGSISALYPLHFGSISALYQLYVGSISALHHGTLGYGRAEVRLAVLLHSLAVLLERADARSAAELWPSSNQS